MAISTRSAGRWPSTCAYLAALTFTAASGGTNFIYGWSKGTDLPSSLVWAGVSLGASIVFALSWPGVLASLDRRQWSRAVMALVALLLTGTYSVTAALGSAMGGRANAALEEQDTTDKRTKAKESYAAAKVELETLKATRAVGELEALLAAARPVCRVHVTDRGRQTVCTKPPALETELARARQRERLKGTMEKASGDLAKAGAGKVANSDAVALARYASDLGWAVDADYMNKLLVLLAVLVIECGGGLSLALAMALSGPSERLPNAEPFVRTHEVRTPDDRRVNAAPNAGSCGASEHSLSPNESLQLAPDARDKSAASVRLLGYLAERGGVLASSQLQLARSLGWSKTWTHEVLHELADRGQVKLDTRPTGTVVRLAPQAA